MEVGISKLLNSEIYYYQIASKHNLSFSGYDRKFQRNKSFLELNNII
jgi:hypothetical protein